MRRQMGVGLLGILLIIGMVGFSSADQNPSTAQAQSPAASQTTIVPAGLENSSASPTAQSASTAQVVSSSSHQGNVSINVQDSEIKNVLKLLAYESGMNIIAGPEVSGLVTIQLNDVPWQKALEVILSTYGFGYDQKGNIITVTTIENLKKRREDALALADQEPLTTKTFTLNYAKASVAITSIDKMKSSRGSVNFDERTNTIIVRDTQPNIDLITDVIKTLDTTTPQVLIEAKVVETTLSDSDKMGVDWVTQASVSAASRPIIFPFKTHSANQYAPDNIPAAADDKFSYGTLNFSQFQAVLELLKTRTNTDILSNPRIVTLDNQKANIVVGSQYPIPTYTFNEQQARLQVSGWEYKDIGIIFDVTPHVNRAGLVTLEIHPKVTAILDFVTVENTSLPRLSNESATTNVMIKDGETLVIAGLIKDQTTDTLKKTPFLGDIPLVGMVFRKKEKTVSKSELIVFLTPHIITPDKNSDKPSTEQTLSQK